MKKNITYLAGASLLFMAGFAGAADWGTVAGNVKGSVEQFKELVVQLGFFIGVVLFVIGMFLIYKDSKESGRGHLKNGIIAIIVGAGLLAMDTVINTTLETGFGNSYETETVVD